MGGYEQEVRGEASRHPVLFPMAPDLVAFGNPPLPHISLEVRVKFHLQPPNEGHVTMT